MRPNHNLIPRFNLDYNFGDFCYNIKSTYLCNDFDLNLLESIFGKRNFFFTNLGRTSLYIFLKALNLPKGSKVGVPLYSCTVVFDAIIKSGYVPYFIDIDIDNYTLDPYDLEEKIEDLSAVVVIHTFGRPADMDEINEIADGIPVIEDCAHSLLSEYKGRITGTLGDASFFSFKKYISAGEGGMLILNDEEFIEDVQKEIGLLKEPSKINEIKHSFFTYIHSSLYHRPLYGLFAFPIGSYINTNIKIGTNREFPITKIRKSDLGIFLKKLEGFREKVELQRRNSWILIDELESTSLILPYEKEHTWCNYYLFPIRFRNKRERDKAHELLRDFGVDSAKLYSETPKEARKFYGYGGNCPNSEIIADTVLVVPNYYTLSEDEMMRVAESIKKVERLL